MPATWIELLVKNLSVIQETLVWFRFRKILWRRKWQPTPAFLPGESYGQRSLAGHSPWDRRSLSDLTWQLNHHHHHHNLDIQVLLGRNFGSKNSDIFRAGSINHKHRPHTELSSGPLRLHQVLGLLTPSPPANNSTSCSSPKTKGLQEKIGREMAMDQDLRANTGGGAIIASFVSLCLWVRALGMVR